MTYKTYIIPGNLVCVVGRCSLRAGHGSRDLGHSIANNKKRGKEKKEEEAL